MDDTAANFITLVLGVGPDRLDETLGDDEGTNTMAQIVHEASIIPDHNCGFPNRISNGLKKILDGGTSLGAPKMPVSSSYFLVLFVS